MKTIERTEEEQQQQVQKERDIKAMVEGVTFTLKKIDREKLPDNFGELQDMYADIIMRDFGNSILSREDAFYKLEALCDTELGELRWDCRKNQGARVFLKQKVLENINNLLTDKNYYYQTPAKEVALNMAKHYADLGILDLNEDREFIDSLTK